MATYTKLSGGAWGIQGTPQEMVPGRRVRVEKRNGTIHQEYVGRIVSRNYGMVQTAIGQAPVAVQAVQTASNPAPVPTPAPVATVTSDPPAMSSYAARMAAAMAEDEQEIQEELQADNSPPTVPFICPGCHRTLHYVPPIPLGAKCPACGSGLMVGEVHQMATPAPIPVEQPKKERNTSEPPEYVRLCIDRAAKNLGKVVMFQYDIHNKSFPDPCGTLRRLAIPITESVWAIQDSRIPWHMLDGMSKADVTWHTVDFASDQAEKLVGMAIQTITKRVKEAEESLAESIKGYDEKLNANGQLPAESQLPSDVAAQKHRVGCRAAVLRQQRLLRDLEEAAKAFGVSEATADRFASMRNTVSSLGNVAQAKAEAYMQMASQAVGTPMQAAAASGEVPASVLADYLEDEGKDVSSVRDLF